VSRSLLPDHLSLPLPHKSPVGSLIYGPWQYQLGSVLIVTPIYTVILVCVATLAGQQAYFMTVVHRMWGRIIPGLRAKKPSD
jgi:hypothetical protein